MHSNSKARILVVEDETDLREAMVEFFNMDGYAADGVRGLRAAEHWMLTHGFDVLLLDLGLPDGDGLHWLQSRTDLLDKIVLISTARSTGSDRVAGVRAGAHAYLVKPVALEEMSALVANLLRKAGKAQSPVWHLNATAWTLTAPTGQVVKLTHIEMSLLSCLAGVPGTAVQRDRLVECLGQSPDLYDPRRMEIIFRRLRSKVKTATAAERPVETVRSVGYAFAGYIAMDGKP